MKTLTKFAVSVISAACLLTAAAPAFAATPFLSVSQQGNGNVQLTVSNADAYSQVTLYRRQSTQLWTIISNFGQTDGSGYFSTQMSLGSDGTSNVIEQYVVVNGQQSSIVQTYPSNSCTYNCGNPNYLSLSQTNLNISPGQSATVTAYSSGGTVYINNYGNTNVVTYTLSGNQITVYGNNAGSATLNVCASGSCASLNVTVSGSSCGYANCGNNTVSLYDNYYSPANLNVTAGTMVTFTNRGSMNHTVTADDGSFNSGNLAPGASFSYTFNTSGTFRYHCIYHGAVGGVGMSGVITVTGNGYGGSLSLSPSSLNMQVGQSTVVYAQNVGGSPLYVSSNPNTSVVSTSISGNAITVNANNAGSVTLSFCTNSGQCGNLSVTVSGYNYGGNISFSQSSVYLNTNQSQSVSIYSNNNYNNTYSISSNSNSSVVSASISGNTLYLIASGTWGTSNIVVCQNSGSSGCGTLVVTVNGYSNCTYNCSGSITVVNTAIPSMIYGQYYSYQLQASGGTPPYTFALSSGVLPAGMYLTSAGLLYGTPQTAQGAGLAIRVTDSFGRVGYGQLYLNGYGINNNATTIYNGNVLGTATYSNGQLINSGGTIYMVYKNTLTAFGKSAAFLGLGYNWNQVMTVGYINMPVTGYVISTAKAAHPWGSWIKSGQTVYFVHELGLIPVSDYSTFLNNGGQASLIVNANVYDFQRPLLSAMVYSDPRLK